MKAKHLMALLGAALMAAALTACARESGEVPSAPQAPASATNAGESADGAAPARSNRGRVAARKERGTLWRPNDGTDFAYRYGVGDSQVKQRRHYGN